MNTSRNLLITCVMLVFLVIIAVALVMSIYSSVHDFVDEEKNEEFISFNTFKIIASSENKDFEEIIKSYASKNDVDIEIEYAGTLEIMEKLNQGEQYDSVWCSNSIWLYMLNEDVKISNSVSTSINPVIFAVTRSKAEELGFIGKELYTQDIISAINNGDLKFSMANPTRTNTGATAFLGLLTTLAGSPEVLREEHLDNEQLKTDLISLFSGLERSSGEEDFLEEVFLQGNYDSVVTYESSIIEMNKTLEQQGKDILYALYPKDGVSISDSPIAYIDNGNEKKEEFFKGLQEYILSDEGKQNLEELGRRTWYGGIKDNSDKNVFNPEWGIDTTKYIATVKYPNTTVIKKALNLYQSELRKSTHVIFCLDYSGSMYGNGSEELVAAMEYILDEEKSGKDLLQFSEKDKISVIPFSSSVIDTWITEDGSQTEELLRKINNLSPTGSTAIYSAAQKALEILSTEDLEKYNSSIIIMTDGEDNNGNFEALKNYYEILGKDIPIYSIMFGNAKEEDLNIISELTNSKIFDGTKDLLKAFKEVRGYN